MSTERADAIRGKTIRLKWSEGPTKGKTHEHEFHEDGTVEWREPGPGAKPPAAGSQNGASPKERPEYGAAKVADEIYADWFPVRGTLEVVK